MIVKIFKWHFLVEYLPLYKPTMSPEDPGFVPPFNPPPPVSTPAEPQQPKGEIIKGKSPAQRAREQAAKEAEITLEQFLK